MQKMKKTTLKNGLRIITVPSKNTQVAAVSVLVKTGSKNEEKNISGISHFLEHMLFKKTKKRPSPLKITEALDKIGGLYNAFTGEEYTCYYAKVNSAHIMTAIDWVSDIYLNSLLPADEMEKEKGVIKEEINMYYDNPALYVQILFQELLYGDQPAGWSIAGTKETVSKITQKDMFDYMKSQYVASNTVVAISGGINTKEAEEEVSRIFSKLKSGNPKAIKETVEKQNKPEVLTSYKKIDQTHLLLGVRGFNIFHPQYYTQKIMAILLGGMMSSRIYIKIREELGIAYYIETSADSNLDTGVVATQAGVSNNKVKEAITTIMGEYERLKNEKVSAKELAKAKEYLKGKMAIQLESTSSLASFYATEELLKGKTRPIEEVFSLIDNITAKDIQDIAKIIFKKENINLAIVGPQKKKSEFEELLQSL
jgi:predicted Zn-dependent peptidase